MRILNVLYQSDNNYAIYMGVSICSLLENNRCVDEINVFIIDDQISEENKMKLRSLVEQYHRNIKFVCTDIVMNNKDIIDAFTYTGMRKNTHSYLKLFVDKLLPEIEGKLLYIDCDTAVDGDVSGIIDLDMGQYAIGMVLDSLVIDSRCSVGMKDDDYYYNSGVILIDLDKWRERDYSARIVNHVKNIRVYGTVDQDILNMEFLNEIYTLPIDYNLQPIHLVYPYKVYSSVYKHKETYYTEEEVDRAVKAPKIIHYLRYMGESPWNEGNVHPGTIFFDKYILKTPWKDYKKKRKNNTFIFKIEKAMYKYLPQKIFLVIFYYVHERMIIKSNRCKVSDR